MNAARRQEARGRCANCEFGDSKLHPVRLKRPTGIVTEALVCRFCLLQLAGVTPATARKATRLER
jgi:hypothetical protein